MATQDKLKPGWQSEERPKQAPKRHLHTPEEYHARRSVGGRKGSRVASANRKLDRVLPPVEEES